MFKQEFQAYYSQAASDEITWRKPRTIIIVIAWSIISTSIMLNVFLSGNRIVGFAFWSISTALPLLLLFLLSIFAGVLLGDLKSIILGVFETFALWILLMYVGMSLPAIVGNAPLLYQQEVYQNAIYNIFAMSFPLVPLAFLLGAVLGGFLEDWLS